MSAQTCPSCGAAAERTQEYCLECGARLARPKRVVHWLWPAVAALLVAAGGATVAIAADATSGGGDATFVALSPLRPAAVKTEKGLVAWPRRDGYTVVIATLPVKTGSETAVRRARRAVRAGLPDVGVLRSANYASLHPGYVVVFSGIYGTLAEAQASLARAKSTFKGAYTQEVTR